MKGARSKNMGGKRPGAGRPSTGANPVTAIRLSPEMRVDVDAWAATQDDAPGRSEAIRRLVELGLTVKTKLTRGTAASADRAKELAAKAIDKIGDPAAHPEERAERRRRLLKGPEEFHDVRVDRAKKK